MTRQEAYDILMKYLTNKNLIKHCLAAEASMRGLARYFGDDEDKWGIVGLLHDADYEMSKGKPEQHGLLLFQNEKDIPEDITYAIKSHNYERNGVTPKSRMDWAITCCDTLTGIIVACALILPEKKLSAVTNEFVIKKMKQPAFASGADRTQIYLCEEKLGMPLLEFVTICLTEMQNIHEDLEL